MTADINDILHIDPTKAYMMPEDRESLHKATDSTVHTHTRRTSSGKAATVKQHQRRRMRAAPTAARPGLPPWSPPVTPADVVVGARWSTSHGHIEIDHIDADTTYFKDADSNSGFFQMPTASVPHHIHDMTQQLHHPPTSGHAAIDAVLRGEGTRLGKGNDGIVYRVGERVVKLSTTTPYQPRNRGHRTPREARDHLRNEHTAHKALAGIGSVPPVEGKTHDGRYFLAKPYLTDTGALSEEELGTLRDDLSAMHDLGWVLNDTVQTGRDKSGKPMLMDLGQAKRSADPTDRDRDFDKLDELYRSNGVTIHRDEPALRAQIVAAIEAGKLPPHLVARDWKKASMNHSIDLMKTDMGQWGDYEREVSRIEELLRDMDKADQIGMFGGTQTVAVHTHTRRTSSGKAATVKQHQRRRMRSAPSGQQRIGTGPLFEAKAGPNLTPTHSGELSPLADYLNAGAGSTLPHPGEREDKDRLWGKMQRVRLLAKTSPDNAATRPAKAALLQLLDLGKTERGSPTYLSRLSAYGSAKARKAEKARPSISDARQNGYELALDAISSIFTAQMGTVDDNPHTITVPPLSGAAFAEAHPEALLPEKDARKLARQLRRTGEKMVKNAKAEMDVDRRTNTPKQQREAGRMMSDAMERDDWGRRLLGIAAGIESGTYAATVADKLMTTKRTLDAAKQAVMGEDRNWPPSGAPTWSRPDPDGFATGVKEERFTDSERAARGRAALAVWDQTVNPNPDRPDSGTVKMRPEYIKPIQQAYKLLFDAGMEHGDPPHLEMQGRIAWGWLEADDRPKVAAMYHDWMARTDPSQGAAKATIERPKLGESLDSRLSRAEQDERRRFVPYDLQKIPGYVETPAPWVERMIEDLQLGDGERVLEPSAGRGGIADRLPQNVAIDVAEWNERLRGQLAGKGYNVVGNDALGVVGKYDKVIMNPPWEKRADAIHTRHAFENNLRPGGIMVALVSGMVAHASPDDRGERGRFARWLSEQDHHIVDIPPSAWAKSNKSVSGAYVVIHKAP